MSKLIETIVLGSALAFNGAATSQTSQAEQLQTIGSTTGNTTQRLTITPRGNVVLQGQLSLGTATADYYHASTCQTFVDRMSGMFTERTVSGAAANYAAFNNENLSPEGREMRQRMNGHIRQSLEFIENGIAACGKTQNPPIVPPTLAPNINTLKSALTF